MSDAARSRRARNVLSLLGAALTTVSAVLFLVFFFLDLAGFHTSPYLGIVTFLLLPIGFVVGLALIPLGVWRARRRAAAGSSPPEWPIIDLQRVSVRVAVIAIVVLTGVNIAIVAMASYKGVEYMDSTGFCTAACHTPMEPESMAHRESVHASISCTSCHVGPGAPGFVTAKLGGVRRLAGVVTGSYERPIPVPVADLPSAAGTCGSCHTAAAYVGDVPRKFRYYSDDQGTTEQVTDMTLRVGGGGWEAGGPGGIHWHASPTTRIEYIATDRTRATIPWVRVTDHRGAAREYTADGVTAAELAAGERRVMDCTDCHNRAGHVIAATPDRAVDDVLARGLLPRLPFVRREAIAALSDAPNDRTAAEQDIARRLRTFYGQQPASADERQVEQAVSVVQQLHRRHVFPAMGVRWGTYPDQIGHTDAPGCFRCHDELHKSPTGQTLTQDCERCHSM